MTKPKAAFYWGASCGGCEIAVLSIHEKILDAAAAVDIVFWPCVMDFKYRDVEAMPDKDIDVCFFNGAIRSAENEEVAKLLRRKSKILIAYGACATEGGIPGLANFTTIKEIFDRAYHSAPSIESPNGTEPQTEVEVFEGTLELPKLYNAVNKLNDVVEVDFYMPGCPPVADQTWNVLVAILQGTLPAPGSVVGVDEKTVCQQCKHNKEEKRITAIHRPHEVVIRNDKCLLEQGVICMGAATRAGCGAQCIEADMPCRGCYGPPAGVDDQGAAMCAALASVLDANDAESIQKMIDTIVDPAGTFYRFGLPASTLRRTRT